MDNSLSMIFFGFGIAFMFAAPFCTICIIVCIKFATALKSVATINKATSLAELEAYEQNMGSFKNLSDAGIKAASSRAELKGYEQNTQGFGSSPAISLAKGPLIEQDTKLAVIRTMDGRTIPMSEIDVL